MLFVTAKIDQMLFFLNVLFYELQFRQSKGIDNDTAYNDSVMLFYSQF